MRDPRSIVNELARIGIYYSLAALLAALYVVTIGLAEYHARIIAGSLMPAFIVSVGAAYSASSLRPKDRLYADVSVALAISIPLTVALSLAYVFLGYSRGYLLMAALAYAGLSSVAAALSSSLKLEARASVALLGYAEVLGGVSYLAVHGLTQLGVYAMAVLALGAIYAVTFHALPSTFGDEGSLLLIALTFVLLTAGVAAAFIDMETLSYILLALSMLLYIHAVRLDRLRSYLAKAAAIKQPVARGGMLYLLYGHLFALAFSIAGAVLLALTPFLHLQALAVIHVIAIGTVGTYIFIHSPLMLPVVLRWANARRYNLVPFASLAVAAVLWPFNMHVAFFFVGLALVFLVLIVRPFKTPYPLMLTGS